MKISRGRKTDPVRFYHDRMLQRLDKSGFVGGLYK
jgi:hypothetical protein